ncbi:MAG: PQQ-binding-like beta-propeller repeat protein [Ktedonobacteraceae bacterium]
MHDIEQQPSQDDTKATLTDLPRQEDRLVVRDAGTTPLARAPKRLRRPFAMPYLVVGGILLLVLAVIFSVVLVRGQPSAQSGTGTAPAQHQPSLQPSPTATPASSSDGSSQFVHITIANGIAYAGGDKTVYALRTDNRTLLWRSQVEGAVGDRPVVADGVVYVTASTDITATLYALRASDGIQLWHSTSNGPEISSLIVANSVVYVGTQADKVLALRAGSGTLLWQYSDDEVGLLSLQLVDGVVYVTANNEQPGNVYALRASDGKLLWHYRAGASLNNSTTVLDGVVYVTSQNGKLTALSTSDGHQLWQRDLGGGNIATMWQPIQALNGVLYVATTRMSEPTASTSSPDLLPQALAMSSLFWGNFQAMPAAQLLPHKEGLSTLYAIRANDGTMLWHFNMNNGKNGMVGWLSLANGVIYTNVMDFSTSNSSGCHIYALQSTTGSVLWHYDDKHTSPYGAVLAHGIIYVSAYSQNRNDVVYALRAGDGSLLWRQGIGQPVYDAPVLNGATVYIGASDGSVYALRASNGAVAWHRGG